MPKMTPNWSQRGSQNGAKIIKNEVLEAPCFKGGSQVASRPPPGSILERFWDHFGTIFVSFLSYFWCCLLAFLLLQFGAQGSLVIEISNTADHVGTVFVSCSNIFIVILARILQQYVGNKTFKITRSHQENAAESFQETASLFVPSCIEKFTSERQWAFRSLLVQVETGQMSAAETGQMSAAETRQTSAVETGQMYSIETRQSPVSI